MKWLVGLLAGFGAGLLDVALIVGTTGDWLVALQSGLFWLVTGMLVVGTDTKLHYLEQGVLLTLALNLPWFINLAIIPHKYYMLVPLIGMSLVYGLFFGWAKEGVNRRAIRKQNGS